MSGLHTAYPILQQASEGGIAAAGPSSTAFGILSGSQELPCESLLREDLHSPEGYFGVGLEDTQNIEISKSMLNAESIPRNQDSDISHPEADIEHAVSTPSESTLVSDPAKCCTCITCQQLGVSWRVSSNENHEPCGIKGCKYIIPGWPVQLSWGVLVNPMGAIHERKHFKTPGGYACAEQGCHFVNKKFTDLQRHYTSKHCTNPNAKNLECPEIGCEYRTARKDKLKEHQKCKHKGKPKPGKPYRVIKPAVSIKPASGTSGMTATE